MKPQRLAHFGFVSGYIAPVEAGRQELEALAASPNHDKGGSASWLSQVYCLSRLRLSYAHCLYRLLELLGRRLMSLPAGRISGELGGSAAEQSLAGVEEFLRVDGFAFDAHFVMQVRSGRAPGRAELADNAACAHSVADRDVDLGEMTVAGH